MALTQKEIALLTASADRYQRGCGDGLILVVEPVHKGGGKSFLGRFRKQINGTTKQIPVRIGVFGSKAGQFTLKQARERWFEIREWAKREGADPRNYGKTIPTETPKNLQNAVDGFLASKASSLREFTLKNYRLQLENQVYPSICPETLLVDLEWDNGGRQIVMNMKTCIEQRGSFDQANRVQKVLAQCFEYAIVQGWMNRNQNPATK
ncbi:MAG: Arm DNA-binding domain-containing protein, partial [Synechococcus sp.]|nr:Arm DNA-binding domain-containing protein [Synechococcus sp.]